MINRTKFIERVKYSLRYKHRRGHRVHSPYVYRLIRELFLENFSQNIECDELLCDTLCEKGLDYNYSYRVAQLMGYNNLGSYVIDPTNYNNEEMIIFSSITHDRVMMLNNLIGDSGRKVVVFLNIYHSKEERCNWKSIDCGLRLDLFKLGIVVVDKHLNNQYFKLKI